MHSQLYLGESFDILNIESNDASCPMNIGDFGRLECCLVAFLCKEMLQKIELTD